MTAPARPPRMTITRMDTGATISAQFNPEEVTEEIGVNFAEPAVLGLSHQPLQYLNTSNLLLNFDMGFDVLSIEGGTALASRRFLHAVCYSSRAAQTVASGGTPDLFFVWPNLYSLVCRLKKLRIVHKRFNLSGLPTLFAASLTLVEVRNVRLYSEDVENYGTMRS